MTTSYQPEKNEECFAEITLNQACPECKQRVNVFARTGWESSAPNRVIASSEMTKQSHTEFVISSPSMKLRINSTRNLDVSRAFDMTNEQKK